MAGAGTAGERQVNQAETIANGGNTPPTGNWETLYSGPKVLETGLTCDIKIAGSKECLCKIATNRCPQKSCRKSANHRCPDVVRKVSA